MYGLSVWHLVYMKHLRVVNQSKIEKIEILIKTESVVDLAHSMFSFIFSICKVECAHPGSITL